MGFFKVPYNQHIPKKALGHIPPLQAMKNRSQKQPQLLKKYVYNLAGLDSAGADATSDRRPLLLRLDRGNDAIENITVVEAHNEQDPQVSPTHYVIK